MTRTKKKEGEKKSNKRRKKPSLIDTTGDPALQEVFLPFGNERNYAEDEDEGSIGDVQEFLGQHFTYQSGVVVKE